MVLPNLLIKEAQKNGVSTWQVICRPFPIVVAWSNRPNHLAERTTRHKTWDRNEKERTHTQREKWKKRKWKWNRTWPHLGTTTTYLALRWRHNFRYHQDGIVSGNDGGTVPNELTHLGEHILVRCYSTVGWDILFLSGARDTSPQVPTPRCGRHFVLLLLIYSEIFFFFFVCSDSECQDVKFLPRFRTGRRVGGLKNNYDYA